MKSSRDFFSLILHCRTDPGGIHVIIKGFPELVLAPATDSCKKCPSQVPGGKLYKEPINQKSSGLGILKRYLLTLYSTIDCAIDEFPIMKTESFIKVVLLHLGRLELQPGKRWTSETFRHDDYLDY